MASTTLPRFVFLTGFMGAGKTSVGRALGRRLGWAFGDLDERIEARESQTIEQIFASAGEAAFRVAERAALREWLAEPDEGSRVVALGGGALAAADTSDLLLRSGFPIVFLDAPVEELWRRCCEQGVVRPLCRDLEQFTDLYHQRYPYYLRASLRVETGSKAIETIVAEIVERLGLEPAS